jgi:hypothetical protein
MRHTWRGTRLAIWGITVMAVRVELREQFFTDVQVPTLSLDSVP